MQLRRRAQGGLWTLVYIGLVCLLGRVLPLRRSEETKEIELLALRHEVAVLRRLVKRPLYGPVGRALLAAPNGLLPRGRWSWSRVRPETLLTWHRRLVARRRTAPCHLPGRPSVDADTEALVVRLARENLPWGYRRIQAELLKHEVRLATRLIARILKDGGLGAAPRRTDPTWRALLRSQSTGVVATDFFTVGTLTRKTLYALFSIELGRRRVSITGVTANPASSWATQQARSVAADLDEPGIGIRVLLRDRDTRHVRSFDEVFTGGAEILKTPFRSPNANPERFVRTVRSEGLDHVSIMNERHLEPVLRSYSCQDNGHRHHQRIGRRIPGATSTVLHPSRSRNTSDPAGRHLSRSVSRRDRLGGLIHEHERAAA
jgi:putative transposase